MTTALTILVQIVLPVGLLVWLGLRPAQSVFGFATQAVGTGLVILALALAAMWAAPPYWVPWLYGLVWVAIVGLRLAFGGLRFESALPADGLAWTSLLVCAGLLVLGGWASAIALAGQRPPPVEVVDIASPFGPGLYLVANGGSTELVNAHLKTLDPAVERFRPWRGQSYALDFFKITPLGLRTTGWRPEDPARYETFGAPLVAPCAGRVAVAVDGLPDLRVPEMDEVRRAGNVVVIDCGAFAVALAHLRQGSLRVAQGDQVEVGDPIGEMGNSGASSEPHLHIHAQRGVPEEQPLAGEPFALRIDGRFLARNDRLRVPASADERGG